MLTCASNNKYLHLSAITVVVFFVLFNVKLVVANAYSFRYHFRALKIRLSKSDKINIGIAIIGLIIGVVAVYYARRQLKVLRRHRHHGQSSAESNPTQSGTELTSCRSRQD